MPAWLALPVAVALMLAAAKAHGRQVRLEREAAGVMHVDFRAANDPRAEAVWRRDRLVFWPAAAVLVAGAAALWWMWRHTRMATGSQVAFAVLMLAWALALAFTVAGGVSRARLGSAGTRVRDAASSRGSLAWWGLVAALWAVSLAAAAL